MPSPRRRPHRQLKNGRISSEAVDAFIAKDWHGLYRALRLRPWDTNPLDVDDEDEPYGDIDPRDGSTSTYRAGFDAAIKLRKELQDAIAP